ncbi:hypothetical protein BDW74DRAFT_180790 [Aspergillus multicolor]|uniref:uncharacterized protein n=1 Tax=Aspergillus multicolor TaxID=41759 RepID=UPI003CCDBD0B
MKNNNNPVDEDSETGLIPLHAPELELGPIILVLDLQPGETRATRLSAIGVVQVSPLSFSMEVGVRRLTLQSTSFLATHFLDMHKAWNHARGLSFFLFPDVCLSEERQFLVQWVQNMLRECLEARASKRQRQRSRSAARAVSRLFPERTIDVKVQWDSQPPKDRLLNAVGIMHRELRGV